MNGKKQQQPRFLWNANPYLDVLNKEVLKSTDNNWLNKVEAEFVRLSINRRKRNSRMRWVIAASVIVGLSGLTVWALRNLRNAQIQEISSLREASEANLVSDNQLDALLQSLQAGKRLRNNQLLKLFPPNSQQQDELTRTIRKVFYLGKESNRLESPSGEIVGIYPSVDGKHLIATDDGKGTISLRNWENLQEKVAEFPGHEGSEGSISVSFSPNGKQMTTYKVYGKNIVIRLWKDINSQEFIKFPGTINDDNYIRDFSFKSNGKQVAILTNKNAFLWDLEKNKAYTFTQFQQETPIGIGFTNNGKLLVATIEGNIFDWYSSKQPVLKKLEDFRDAGNARVIFSPDGNQFLKTDAVHRCFPVQKYEFSENTTASELKEGCVVEYSPDATKIGIGNEDGTIYLHDLKKETQNFIELKAHQGDVAELSFSSDSKQLFSLGEDNTIKSFKIESKNLDNSQSLDFKSISQNREANQDASKFIGFSADGNQIITMNSDGSIFLSNLSGTQKLLLKIEPDLENKIIDAVVSSDLQKIAIARKDNTIQQINISSNKSEKILKIPKNKEFKRMNFHYQNGDLIAITEEKNSSSEVINFNAITDLWKGIDANDSSQKMYGEPISFSFSTDGDLLLHTSQDITGGEVRIESFNVNKQQRATFFDITIHDRNITVSQDSHLIATSTDGWNCKIVGFLGQATISRVSSPFN